MDQQQIDKREKIIGHAVASPSQLYRILACPGSFYEVLKAPISPPSSYAQHGTHLHEIVSSIILKRPQGSTMFKLLEVEDKNAVEDCLDFAKDLIQDSGGLPEVRIEKRVDLSSWGLDGVWGTLDLSVVNRNTYNIVDWKFGSGVRVYAQDNEQLLAYSAGMVKFHSDPGFDCNVVLHVVQPFLNHYDSWKINYQYIRDWVFEVLEPGLIRAQNKDAPYSPGEKQCKFCPAGMTCRARLEAAIEAAKEVFRMHSNLAIVTKAELADVLQRARSMNKYASQIETYAATELSHGRGFPGYKLVAGRSIRKWVDENKAEAWLLGNSRIKEGDLFSKKFISPAQAEKLDRLLKKDNNFSDLIDRPPGKPQLVTDEDPRPAIEPNSEAAKVFGDWQESEE